MRTYVLAFLLVAVAVVGQPAEAATATFKLPSGVVVRIDERSFDPGKAVMLGCGQADTGCVINGHVAIGSAGLVPRTYIQSITLSIDGTDYSLDVTGMYNAWNGRPLEVKGAVRYFGGSCWNVRNCKFRGLFSDAGGAFVAEWAIIDGKAERTVLSDSSDLIELFRKNIDPPVAD